MYNTIQSMHNVRRVDITCDMEGPWVKDIYDNVVANEKVMYLVCDGDIMFVINRNDFDSTQAYLIDGVRSSVLLTMDGNFSIYIIDDKKKTDDDVFEFSNLLGNGIIDDAVQDERCENM